MTNTTAPEIVVEEVAPTTGQSLWNRISEFVLRKGVPTNIEELKVFASEFLERDISAEIDSISNAGNSDRPYPWDPSATNRIGNWIQRFKTMHGFPQSTPPAERNSGYAGVYYQGREVGRRAHRSLIWHVWGDEGRTVLQRFSNRLRDGDWAPGVPVVITEQRQFAMPVFEDGDPDFVQIQLLTNDNSRRELTSDQGGFRLPQSEFSPLGDILITGNFPEAVTAIAPDVAQMEAEGWIVRRHSGSFVSNVTVTRNIDNIEVPLWATPPEGHEAYGRVVVLFVATQNITSMANLLHLAAQQVPLRERNEVEVNDRETLDLFMQLMASGQSLNNELSTIESRIEDATRRVEEYSNTIAAEVRQKEDNLRRKQGIMFSLPAHALEQVRGIVELPNTLESLKPIKSFKINSSFNESSIEFVTHRFGMRAVRSRANHGFVCSECNSDRCSHVMNNTFNILIPEMKVKIGTSRSDFNGSVQVKRADGGPGAFHPHVNGNSGRVCWGNAALGLAEAWGRRDWETFVRLILGWATIYNDHSPYHQAPDLVRRLGEPPSMGWITEPVESTTTATSGDTA